MMLRIAIAIGLLMSLSFFVNEGRRSMLPGESPVAIQPVKAKGPHSISGQKKFGFYPEVPVSLPDLRDGYLFNEERMLAPEEEGEDDEDLSGQHDEIRVNMDDVLYVGSLITGDVHKGLVSYPAQRKSPKSQNKVKRTTKKTLRSPKNRDYARLLVGESFSDYKVVEIETDRIKFVKGGKMVVKLLNDPAKERIKPPPIVKNKRIKPLKKAAVRSQPKKAVIAKRQRVKVKTAAPRTVFGDKQVKPPPLPKRNDIFQ